MGVEDRIVIVDAATGRARTMLAVAAGQVDDSRGFFSPDGSRFALVLGAAAQPQRIRVLDTADGTVRAILPLDDSRRLAGWDAEGARLVYTAAEVCDWTACARDAPDSEHARAALARQRWHLQFDEVPTGRFVDELRTGRTGWPERLVGWHGRDAVWIMGNYPAGGASIEAVRPGEPARVLAASDGPAEDLDVARDLVGQGRFGGPAIDAPLWPARAEWRWAFAIGMFGLIALLLVVRGLVGMTRRRWPSPAPPTRAGLTSAGWGRPAGAGRAWGRRRYAATTRGGGDAQRPHPTDVAARGDAAVRPAAAGRDDDAAGGAAG
ncbi:hypothetical protein [Dactylosporangium sp. CA-233914]|uniref:hypothetical protein n=1 Tax=Dactylosporangium sp. CA-233914 TaxID=3239934 RepID=UPI003D8DAEFC